MTTLPFVLTLAHLIGLALGVGAASAKLVLLRRCTTDDSFVPTYLAIARPITRLIILGLVLLTASGVGWLLLGYRFTPFLVVKVALVAAIWVLGPIIDNVVEPAFRNLAPAAGESPSPDFVRARQRYVRVETLATGLFYVIVVMGVRL
jgi:hypothetical protein